MPFQNPEQERAIFAKDKALGRRWVHKYGHAPGNNASAAKVAILRERKKRKAG